MEGRSVSFRSSTKVAKRWEFCLLQNICYSCLSARLRVWDNVPCRPWKLVAIAKKPGSYIKRVFPLLPEYMTDS